MGHILNGLTGWFLIVGRGACSRRRSKKRRSTHIEVLRFTIRHIGIYLIQPSNGM